ncbi:MAG: D-glycero-beta-D-manno-heptose 1-phosphate adenylyltransferase [Gemmatimonadetes bacterium]|nr:D-glycero-beta-D-manno-heptose 1-phosphate adenylyltransferase [Gemmatimonadota bacterium]
MKPRSPAAKVLSQCQLVERFGPGRSQRVVFTNGCFELLHAGHVTYLDRARALGDALVVGVNTDASARRLGKGAGRPIVEQDDRALVVAALESVDAVCLFDEDTPERLISEIVPDVLVKGADWRPEDVVGREVVETAGGHVELIPILEHRSTTEMLRRAREAT